MGGIGFGGTGITRAVARGVLGAGLILLAAASPDMPVLRVTGDVLNPLSLSLAEIEAMPAKTVNADFHTMHGDQHHDWSGVLLADLIARAGLKNEQAKNAALRHTLMVQGKDGYSVAVAYGEIDKDAGNKPVLLAYRRDGQTLDSLRLVLPQDPGGARQVHDVTQIEIR